MSVAQCLAPSSSAITRRWWVVVLVVIIATLDHNLAQVLGLAASATAIVGAGPLRAGSPRDK
jgi:hypothetical protein